MSLQAGLDALKQQRYPEAIQLLEQVCETTQPGSGDWVRAKMGLAQAYPKLNRTEDAIAICQQLLGSSNEKVRQWARNARQSLTKPNARQSLQQGQLALKQKNFSAAIEALEQFQRSGINPQSPEYGQAQMALIKAYRGAGRIEDAIALCEPLTTHTDPLLQQWAQQALGSLHAALAKQAESQNHTQPETAETAATESKAAKAGRAAQRGVRLAMKNVAGSLALASGVTISLLFGMVLVLFLALFLIVGSDSPGTGLATAIGVTLIFNLAVFFLSPFIMDIVQGWLYNTQWVSLAEIQRHSPEAARVIQEVCAKKKLKAPKLGIIPDENPTAFTYGSLPDTARVVVSHGLFTYLDDDEVATVYAHELGHVVHWDFAVMTVAATLVQITYLIYVFADEFADHFKGDKDNQLSNGIRSAAIAAYIFYIIGTYLVLYLSRTREYYADHFAAEMTGNPNGLSRALVKIAYGILEQGDRETKKSRVLQGTRALGIYDPKAATSTGTAYRVASDTAQVGKVFLWDMFNPWAWWMELNSTHPLTGKRVRALSTYAEQLGLDVEFDMAAVVRDGKRLSKKRLYGNFVLDVVLFYAEFVGLGLGALVGFILYTNTQNVGFLVGLSLLGLGLGSILKTFVMYPGFGQSQPTDIFTLMCDPYASPLRARPAQLKGKIIGRGDAGYVFGSELQFQDDTGMIFVRYASLWGPLGNFFFGWLGANELVGANAKIEGWFRRGIAPSLDLKRMAGGGKTTHSYPRFWSVFAGGLVTIVGFVILALAPLA
jgi:Zn-dependent protease with chaperone function